MQRLFRFIFTLGCALRVLLFLANRSANDNHVQVIQRLLAGQMVGRSDCWECFQPKFYHEMVAFFVQFLPKHGLVEIILTAEFFSLIAGIATLWILWMFLSEYAGERIAGVLAFAFIALNPNFLGINTQATNDSFVILFSTAAFYGLWKYLQETSLLNAFVLIFSVTFAALSKGSGWVVFLGVYIVLLIHLIKRFLDKTTISKEVNVFLVFNLVFLFFLLRFSPYFAYYHQYGTFFVVNQEKVAPPAFLQKSYVRRPGIVSIADSYFTFRFGDLLAHPHNTLTSTNYPLHRTSFWSQLYGQFNSIHFFYAPKTWQDNSLFLLTITRLILILALPLAAVIVLGFVSQIYILLEKVKRRKFTYFDFVHHFIFVFLGTLFLVANLYYSYSYRDFSFVKIIFWFPILICFSQCIVFGIDFLVKYFRNERRLYFWFGVYCWILCGLYVLDVVILISQLQVNIISLLG